MQALPEMEKQAVIEALRRSKGNRSQAARTEPDAVLHAAETIRAGLSVQPEPGSRPDYRYRGFRKRISRTPDFSSSESKISSPAKRKLMSRFCRTHRRVHAEG
jgi:hypothetical protein